MILKRPLAFATPSVVNDTPEARAKVERDYKKIVRYLGAKRVRELNKEIGNARKGNKPDRALNELVLAQWDAAPVKDPTEFSEDFFQKYPQGHSAPAVKKRLERQLKKRDRDQKLKAALQRPSLVGEARGTK